MAKVLSQRIKGVIRAEKKRKEKFAPKGGGFAAQAKRTQVNKSYQGIPKKLKAKPKITFL
ncbi:hypothetical protein HY620_00650 [Candidatus Uhrbacteria bacterium]|nr:hypothetical protein [Candidatus Uhrbacteria bacterium]